MSFVGALTSVVPSVLSIIDKVVPDKGAAELAKSKIELELVQAATEINRLQAETNKVEAAHRSIWVAGWRPAIGWCSALGVAYFFVLEPLLQWAAVALGWTITTRSSQRKHCSRWCSQCWAWRVYGHSRRSRGLQSEGQLDCMSSQGARVRRWLCEPQA